MCFSAQTVAAYRRFEREYGAVISLQEFVDLYGARFADKRIKIPKAMDLAFADARNDGERQLLALIDRYAVEQASALEQEVFAQRTRLAEAERKLRVKSTKAAPTASASPPTRWTGRCAGWPICGVRSPRSGMPASSRVSMPP